MLTSPDGRPIPSGPVTELTTDQAASVAAMMIHAQIDWLIAVGVPPPVVVSTLQNLSAMILGGLEPASVRNVEAKRVADRFVAEVGKIARERLLAQAVPHRPI